MGSLFGSRAQSVQQEVYGGIQVSASLYGGAIPLVYGTQRVRFNLIWYGDFNMTPGSSPGKGGSRGGGSNIYSAAFAAALCIGPINSIGQVWHDKAIVSLAFENLSLSLGGAAPPIWSFLTTNFPAQAIPYDHIAYVATPDYNFGSSPSMPNLTFEVVGLLPYSFANGMIDADPAQIIPDYLTDVNHGAGFQGTVATLTGTTNTYQAYVQALGMLISPYEDTQRSATDFLKDILQITNSDIVLSVGTLKVIPYADQPISATTADGTHWSYTPNLTPLFSFTDSDYMPAEGDEPVQVTRKPQSETYNDVNVEYVDRANYYNTAIVNASDLGNIVATQVRTMPALTFHQITTPRAAKIAAQLILQASLYERSTYKFRVRADYGLLEPMDLVAVTDSNLGLVNQVARIISVENSADHLITLTCMEVPGVTRSTPVYDWQAAQGYFQNYAVSPGSVLAPAIFQLPDMPATDSEGLAIGIAVCGPSSSAFWGGCSVYMSVDGGSNYFHVGTVGAQGPARYGVTTSAINAVADPDSTSVLGVTLANTNLQLQPVTHQNADENQTLALIGTGSSAEVVSYGSATLTAPGSYNLSYLRRGIYGTGNVAHGSAVQFVRLDGAIFNMPVDPGMAGKQLFFKFTSFNIYGQGEESVASVAAYSYVVPTGPINGAAALVPRGACAVNGDMVYKATTATAGWNADCVSSVASANGAHAYARYGSGAQMAVGLVASITTTLNPLTNMDYALMVNGSAYQVREAGVQVASITAVPTAGDVLQVIYDGFWVRYYLNGVVQHQTAVQGLTLYMGVALFDPGDVFTEVEFNSLTASTPVGFLSTGNAVVADTSATKIGGVAAWDSLVYSIKGYTNCHIRAKPNAVTGNNRVMVGLCIAPLAASPASNEPNMDFGWSLTAGNWTVYENVTGFTSSFVARPNDVVWVVSTGLDIRYFLNDPTTPVHINPAGNFNVPLYGVVALFDPLAGVNSLLFDAGVNIALQDTGQMGQNSATITIVNANNSSGTVTGVTGRINLGVVVNSSNSPNYACTVIVTATIQARQTVGTAGQMRLVTGWADDSVNFLFMQQEVPIASSTFQQYTLQWQFSHSAANVGKGQAAIFIDNTGAGTNSSDWQIATLQAEFILR